jgi:flagellar hook assembly protein FlgD
LLQREAVELTVYNLAGQKVAVLVYGAQAAGSYTVHWDGLDGDGRQMGSGVYIVRLQTDKARQTRKILLVR